MIAALARKLRSLPAMNLKCMYYRTAHKASKDLYGTFGYMLRVAGRE